MVRQQNGQVAQPKDSHRQLQENAVKQQRNNRALAILPTKVRPQRSHFEALGFVEPAESHRGPALDLPAEYWHWSRQTHVLINHESPLQEN